MPAPCLLSPKTLHLAMEAVQTGYIPTVLRAGPGKGRPRATTVRMITNIAKMSMKAVVRSDQELSWSSLAQVRQYSTFDRPISCTLTLVSGVEVEGFTVLLNTSFLASGRENKLVKGFKVGLL